MHNVRLICVARYFNELKTIKSKAISDRLRMKQMKTKRKKKVIKQKIKIKFSRFVNLSLHDITISTRRLF